MSSWGDLTDKPDEFPPEPHTHPQSEVDGLVSALAGKAPTSHTQQASTISDSTPAGRALLTAADAAAQRSALGLGSLAQKNDVAWSALSGTSPALTFGDTEQALTLSLSGNTTFTASGYAQGRVISIFITADGSLRTLAFPAWTWLEGSPASIAASKNMMISLVCTGATAGSVFATYGVQA